MYISRPLFVYELQSTSSARTVSTSPPQTKPTHQKMHILCRRGVSGQPNLGCAVEGMFEAEFRAIYPCAGTVCSRAKYAQKCDAW